ncbi:Chromo domain-containing protein [Meloidogyne graminicola]|uniref:Chromo domain-containing protein n=1 Tax=Meloidogyne graminicola TaxID=189291 RepID=A0A8T0A2M9_9BILA|nr:Chromo domain-containing protein [Meloidogyne graminicola]
MVDVADEEIDVVTTEETGSIPPEDDYELDEEYEVEKILKQKKTKHGILYLVKWKGYSSDHDSWEPEENLSGAKEALDAFFGEQRKSKKKGVKRSAGETSRTPKRVKSITPESVKNGEVSGEDDDDEFIVDSSNKRNNKQSQKGKGTSVTASAKKKQAGTSRDNNFSSSDSRIGTIRNQAMIMNILLKFKIYKTKSIVDTPRRKNNVFNDWLDSDEEDERRSASEGKNINNNNDIKKNENEELKINSSEENEEEKIKIISNNIEIEKDNNLTIDSPPPPTDPEGNGNNNTNGTVVKSFSSLLSNISEQNNNLSSISTKELLQNEKQKKSNKKEREVSIMTGGKKPSSSEFRIDVMFRDNVGKLKLVANMGTLSECQITINAQLEKELASFLKTKIKPGGRKSKSVSDDDINKKKKEEIPPFIYLFFCLFLSKNATIIIFLNKKFGGEGNLFRHLKLIPKTLDVSVRRFNAENFSYVLCPKYSPPTR